MTIFIIGAGFTGMQLAKMLVLTSYPIPKRRMVQLPKGQPMRLCSSTVMTGRHGTDCFDERGCGGGERGVLAPGEIDVADEHGRERAEHDALGELLRDHPVDADRRAETRLDENRRVVDEVVVGDYIQLPKWAAEPPGEKLFHHRLARADERDALRVLRRYALLRGERRILPDGKPPMVRVG